VAKGTTLAVPASGLGTGAHCDLAIVQYRGEVRAAFSPRETLINSGFRRESTASP
jgi:hypothetical protein